MTQNFITISRDTAIPVWRQIYEQAAAAVKSGTIKKGEKLPSIRQLADALHVSRSPVENAYTQLVLDGYADSRTKSGYFALNTAASRETLRSMLPQKCSSLPDVTDVLFDFLPGSIDPSTADLDSWRRCLRAALNREKEVISRGDPCGEAELRVQLANYARRARGVRCESGDIIIASGTQQLLTLLLRATGRGGGSAAMEPPCFTQALRVLEDFGWETRITGPDSGAPDIPPDVSLFFETASKRAPLSPAKAAARRAKLAEWARVPGRILIEDGYNGELRYVSRPIPAMQALAPESIIYIGSFSQLLLPSVRAAYMVLPPETAELCRKEAAFYDQTASKVEQLALAAYIKEGLLERHLRRSRKVYLRKSKKFAQALSLCFGANAGLRLLETDTAFAVSFKCPECSAEELRLRALEKGIKTETLHGGGLNELFLSFAATPEAKLEEGAIALRNALCLDQDSRR